MRYAVSVSLLSCSFTSGKDTKFRDELKTGIRVSETVATNGKPNAWCVNQEVTCLWRTRLRLIFDSIRNPLFRPKFGNSLCR
jgi:hypothetical protein